VALVASCPNIFVTLIKAVEDTYLTLILTAWEFKKPFCKIENKSWMVEANIFKKSKMPHKKS
jgi:hypothetical protein